MADYYSVLRRAIDSLRPNTEETRQVLYERARATLVAQLAGLNPPASDTQVAEQQNQLANGGWPGSRRNSPPVRLLMLLPNRIPRPPMRRQPHRPPLNLRRPPRRRLSHQQRRLRGRAPRR